MSSYSELIKNFETIRAYMREFYVYGFKSRDEYNKKSARSYDDERRRIESWLGDHMGFVRTPDGKSVFISIDSRQISHNPFHKAWRAKSFTDGDITLHFILFDILSAPEVKRTLAELIAEIDERYLADFPCPMTFDESTIRKKLKEYCDVGIIAMEKVGRRAYYHRTASPELSGLTEALHYFSEVAPCGVVGAFILDKMGEDSEAFSFKHHYITGAIDSGVLASLFAAMREGRSVTVTNLSPRSGQPRRLRLVPLRVFISVQSGRHHLIAYAPEYNSFMAYRVDYLSQVKAEEVSPRFDELRATLDRMEAHTWGVGVAKDAEEGTPEHVEFTVTVGDGEEFIVNRLEREKRIGRVEKLDEHTYRFSAEVYDPGELVPWMRTFLCRITDVRFENRALERRFKADLRAMYRLYGVGKEDADDIQ